MSLLLDAIILFSVICIVWSAARRGFVRAFMNLLSTVASFIVAYVYTPTLAAIIDEKLILSPITGDIHATLRSMSLNPNTMLFDLDKLADDVPAPLVNMLDRYNVDLNEFIDKIRGLVDCPEETVYGFAEEIATPVSSVISAALAFIIILLGASIVLKLITELLDYIFMLPALKSANTVLGVIFGVIEGAAVACVLAMALSNLVQIMGAIDPNLFGADVLDNTLICKHLDNFGIFSKIREVLG
ncbi:MAG: CvpA family protein [Ruminococcaceae bacterium]|nr:CvpA family protein [Oscillospiraceae bacterium]